MSLSLIRDGAEYRPSAIDSNTVKSLVALLSRMPPGRPGARLWVIDRLMELVDAKGPVGMIAAAELGPGCQPVRALLLDKGPGSNRALGWHQDRTVAVRERLDAPGFGRWSTKAGLLHAEPPWEVLAGMVTLRAHLDPVSANNAPLLVAPGSHRLGRVPEGEVAAAVAPLGQVACLAEAGYVWLYSTPVLHASERAAAGELPGGLRWLGV